jgi:hypothetical protein
MGPEDLKKIAEAADKLPVQEIYEDLLQPGFRKVGEALGTLIEFGTIPVLPLKLLNAKARYYFGKNITVYERKLEQVKNEPTIQVPEYIGIPILEKFTYLNNQVLSEAFSNLLTKASFESTIGLAHPFFITILNNLAADEAKILLAVKDSERVPLLDLKVTVKPNLAKDFGYLSKSQQEITLGVMNSIQKFSTVPAAYNLTGLEKTLEIDFPDLIDVYLENLEFNGIIKFVRDESFLTESEIYEKLETEIYSTTIKEFINDVTEIESEFNDNSCYIPKIQRGYFCFTEIGKLFVKACIEDMGK